MSKQIKDEDGHIYIEHKPWYKKISSWVLILVAILMFFYVIGRLNRADEQAQHRSSETHQSVSSKKESSEKSSSSEEANSTDEPVGESTSLGAGTWTVGKDIKPGIYVLTSPSGSGNVDSDPKNYEDTSINIILGAGDDDQDLTNYRAYLSNGDKVNISGLNTVNFQADKSLNNASSDKYISGQYKIGTDIQPGRYKINAVTGSGNLMTDGSVNEILSTDPEDGEVSSTTVDLEKGETLNSDVQMIELIKQ
ncbi:hypothetical protein JK159_08405 [Weissella minor]|uniref:hypothetical protein n=1 Tax=Weissella minor TaxID=1620 RepID=UPI001BAFA7DD|nr:hypothetical protein [Weissella minor]MBS0950376.1 hypothetical protein [Weissella minor]